MALKEQNWTEKDQKREETIAIALSWDGRQDKISNDTIYRLHDNIPHAKLLNVAICPMPLNPIYLIRSFRPIIQI